MTPNRRADLLGVAVLLALILEPQISRAELFQYRYTGEVTSVENNSGFFSPLATVGTPVSGSFSYPDHPSGGSEEFSPEITFYLHERSVSAATDLVVRIGGVEARASDSSLTNVAVGNNNTDPLPPYFPEGDFLRYIDELDRGSTLFDFTGASLEQFPFGNIILGDSTGTALTSQALPSTLLYDAFDERRGIILITDENSDIAGRLEFEISSIQAIPEPSTAILLATGVLAVSKLAANRRPGRKSFRKRCASARRPIEATGIETGDINDDVATTVANSALFKRVWRQAALSSDSSRAAVRKPSTINLAALARN